MEPRGCNRWQSAANRLSAKRRKHAKTVAVGCDRLPETFHGKEGVDGSSPSEGSKTPAKRRFLLSDLIHKSTSLARRGLDLDPDHPRLRPRQRLRRHRL